MKTRKFLPLVLALVALALLTSPVAQADTPQPVTAQQPAWPQQMFGAGACLEDECGKLSCSASDVSVALVITTGVTDYCTSTPGDTGTYTFQAEFIGQSQTRYDPTIWIATDGGTAATGACYRDYLRAPLQSTGLPLPTTPIYGPPFWDMENNGDVCGDIRQDQPNYEVVGPVTISCVPANLDGNINVCTAWDNAVNKEGENCAVGGQCPGTPAKCRCQSASFEVNLNQVDLACGKAASVSTIPANGQFNYLLTVSNVGTAPCYQSTGYKITDNLSIWLKAGTLPAGCTSKPDTSEVCNGYAGGCEGFGDIVECTVMTDLECPATAPDITLPVQLWKGVPTVPTTDPRYTGPAPTSLPNTAQVAGFEVDPASGNNTCSVEVPTAVDLLSFTVTGARKTAVLNWETASGAESAGFNLYRAVRPRAEKVKVNDALIPTDAPPGSPDGAEYECVDENLRPRHGYWYWLEDVDIYGRKTLHGPIVVKVQ